MNKNKEKCNYRKLKEGLSIVTNIELKNGDIIIPKGSVGQIIYAKNQVNADIWFYDYWEYKKYLNVVSDSFKRTQFRGVVLSLKSIDFSIKYSREEHAELMFDSEKLEDVPYLDLSNLKSYESGWYKNNNKVFEYRLADIIEQIEDSFSFFVKELEQRPTTEDDSFDLDYIFTDKSLELFEIEKNTILEPFMKATGIYYNFLGGAIEG